MRREHLEPVERGAQPRTESLLYPALFWALLFAFLVLVLSLPLFPTGDGPLHIYFATVFHAVATHSTPVYDKFYAVRHLIQPYSVHYYALILLESLFSADTAEKILICIVMCVLALGFRSLVNSLSPSSPALPLCIFPFLLSWPLSVGMLNYVLGIGLLLWALSFYYRALEPPIQARHFIGFSVVLLLLVLTHPVPILLLILIVSTDLLLSFLRDSRAGSKGGWLAPKLLAIGLSCLAFAVPVLISDKGQVRQSLSDVRLHSYYIHYIVAASRIRMFYEKGRIGSVYDLLLALTLPAAFLLVLRSGILSRLRNSALTSADRLAIFAAAFLALSLFVPEDMNGSSLFAVRLWLVCWLVGIASAAGAIASRRWNIAVASISVLLACWTLAYAFTYLRPVAYAQAQLEHAPLPYGARGIFIQSTAGDQPFLTHTTYSVNFWEAGRAFASHHDVLLNSPWMQLTIMPVKENGAAGLMRDYAPLVATEQPNGLGTELAQDPQLRSQALQSADFLLFVDPSPDHSDPLLLARTTLGSDAENWKCTPDHFYAVCVRS